MDLVAAVCAIKKVTTCEDNFWKRDMHYVNKNNGIHTYFNEMKHFYFIYRVMNVNLVLSILLLVMIEICFGLNFDNAQLYVLSFSFGCCLGKRRPPQVYVEINDCIFRLTKWMQ